MSERMKHQADHENETADVTTHEDRDRNRVTAVVQLPPAVAAAVTDALVQVVREGHAAEQAFPTPAGVLKRAQEFEEGDVFLLAPPFERYFADRYLMDFYDVRDRDICSRMHVHTGLRFVRMMTGPGSTIRVSSLSPLDVTYSPGWPGQAWLDAFEDENPPEGDDEPRTRYNVVVPPNSWVDMQVPRGTSHQFNAVGPHAVIDSVHPEESIETLREGMSGYRMMAQTIFLAEERPAAETCLNSG